MQVPLNVYNSGTAFNNPNGLVSRIHMFDTQLNDLSNFMNDLRVTKKFDKVGASTAGYFKSIQKTSNVMVVELLLTRSIRQQSTFNQCKKCKWTIKFDNGLYAYGVPAWGNCCTRNYDTQYNVSAPYVNVSVDATENLSFEGGLRYDLGKVSGSFAVSAQTEFDTSTQ